MAEKKLSEELRFCIEQDGCSKCSCFETKSKLTCPGLLQKAYEVVKRYEEMFPCNIGDTVYTNHSVQGWYFRRRDLPYKAEVVHIGISNGVNNYINVDFGNGHMLQFKFSDIGKTVFLARQEAEDKLAEMEGEK